MMAVCLSGMQGAGHIMLQAWRASRVCVLCRRFDGAMEELSELVRRNHRSLDATQKALLAGIT